MSKVQLEQEEIPGQVLGEMVWLWSHSKIQGSWPFSSIHRWLLPPLKSKQYRIYHRGKKPVGCITWAWLSEETQSRYVRNPSSIDLSDWQGGDNLWFIDFVAPFGDASAILRDMKKNVFPDQVGRFLREKEGSQTHRIMYAHGINALKKSRDLKQFPPVIPENS